jgi:carboxyl-terminal processing protease
MLHDKQQHRPENDSSTPTVPKNRVSLQGGDPLTKGLGTATTTSLLCSLALFLSISFLPALSRPALASSYTSTLSDEQKVVAEAWRLVDNSFLDRTFNGQDWFKLRQDFVQKRYKNIDEAHAAIDEMITTLGDKYTRYLSPGKYKSLVDSATGTLGSSGAGVGVQISINEQGQIIASDVEPNSPASKAGIRVGDVFVEVDGVRFLDDARATPDDVAARLRGPEGSKVGVVMLRNNNGGQEATTTLDFRITRQPIKITAVQSYLSSIAGVSGKVGVVRIKNFSGTTAATVSKAVAELKAKGAQSLVLDVRGSTYALS